MLETLKKCNFGEIFLVQFQYFTKKYEGKLKEFSRDKAQIRTSADVFFTIDS